MDREEWVRRFKERIITRADLPRDTPSTDEIVKSELESWPETEDDWKDTEPEDAADDNLSYWTE